MLDYKEEIRQLAWIKETCVICEQEFSIQRIHHRYVCLDCIEEKANQEFFSEYEFI